MYEGTGKPVFAGVAIGPVQLYRPAQRQLPESSGDPAAV